MTRPWHKDRPWGRVGPVRFEWGSRAGTLATRIGQGPRGAGSE